MSSLKKGDRVQLSLEGKIALAVSSSAHLDEFKDSEGVVLGLTNYNNKGEKHDPAKVGPEFDVRWEPENLRYAYAPEHLEKVEQ